MVETGFGAASGYDPDHSEIGRILVAGLKSMEAK
jgi:hypothetical protein